MKKHVLEKAEKDINAIKDIINRTTDTFISLGRIFIGWGLGFLILCFTIISMYLFRYSITNLIQKYPFVPMIPIILAALAAFASCLIISGRKGFIGLAKPLLAVWMVIITYVTVLPITGYLPHGLKYFTSVKIYNMDITYYFISYTNVDSLLFAFAFGLLCIRLFTNLKFAGLLSLIYSVLAFISIIYPTTVRVVSNKYFSVSIISYCIILPMTLLILGGYLEFCRARRNWRGYKFNS